MKWWRWYVFAATVALATVYHASLLTWFLLLWLTLWPLRVSLVFDRPDRITDADLEALLGRV